MAQTTNRSPFTVSRPCASLNLFKEKKSEAFRKASSQAKSPEAEFSRKALLRRDPAELRLRAEKEKIIE